MTIAQIQSGARPAPRAASSEPPSDGEGDFAQLMALQAPAEDTPPAGRADEARHARHRQAARDLMRAAPAEPRRDRPDVAKGQPDPARPDADADAKAIEPALDPALAQWLSSLHRPAPADEKAPADAELRPWMEDARSEPGQPRAMATAMPDSTHAAADHRAGHGQSVPRHGEKSPRDAAAAVELQAPRAADETASPAVAAREAAPAAAPAGFALPAGFEPVATTSPGAAPVVAETPVLSVPVPVPMSSPEFAEAFGLEISVLAREGVQQAELHLNPAEMGPVSVQIALDGEKARIDFGAQAAATRAAIEASLPELAAALRDAGLTLAGGGVSQHAGQRGDGARDGESSPERPGARGRADAVSSPADRPAWRCRAGPGGVDLYA